MIADQIIGTLNLPNNDLKVKLEIEVEFGQDELRGINSDYDFWQLILDSEPHRTTVISAELVKHDGT